MPEQKFWGPNTPYETEEQYEQMKGKWITMPGDTVYQAPAKVTELPSEFEDKAKELGIDESEMRFMYYNIMRFLAKKYKLNLHKLSKSQTDGIKDYTARILNKCLTDNIEVSYESYFYDTVSKMADELTKEDKGT